LVPVLRSRFGLVQALERAVMPLVEPPVPYHGDPHLVELIQHDPERADGPLQDRRVGDVELVVQVSQAARGLQGFFSPQVGEVDVGPSGEEVLQVPVALAVAAQNQFASHALLQMSVAICSEIAIKSGIPQVTVNWK